MMLRERIMFHDISPSIDDPHTHIPLFAFLDELMLDSIPTVIAAVQLGSRLIESLAVGDDDTAAAAATASETCAF